MTARTHTGIPRWGDHAEAEPVGALERWEEPDAVRHEIRQNVDMRHFVATIASDELPFEPLHWSGVICELAPTPLSFDAAWREAEVLRSVGRSEQSFAVGDRVCVPSMGGVTGRVASLYRDAQGAGPFVAIERDFWPAWQDNIMTGVPMDYLQPMESPKAPPEAIKAGSPVYIENDDWCMGGAECTVKLLTTMDGKPAAVIVEDGRSLSTGRAVLLSELELRPEREGAV